MPDIDLTKVGFVGNFQGVTCANDLIVIDGKDFNINIKIKNVEREITHCVISTKWLEELTEEEFDKFYGIFSNLLNAKNTAQSVEEKPKPTTIDVANGDIWFVIKDDGSTPNKKLLPQIVITYAQSARILNKEQGLQKIKNYCHMWPNEETKCALQEFKKRKGEDEEKTIEQETLSNALKQQGFNALNDDQKSYLINYIATEYHNIERQKNTDNSNRIVDQLKNTQNLTKWQKWVMDEQQQMTIRQTLQELNSNEWQTFARNVSISFHGNILNETGGLFGGNIDLRDKILIKLYDTFCDSTFGNVLPKFSEINSEKKHIYIRRDNQIAVDEQNIHHRLRRWKNIRYVYKENVHHRFRKHLNKKAKA